MGNAKILIIDDNGGNGVELSRACKRQALDWDVTWLRIIAPEPDPLDEELEGVTYQVVGKADEAAAAIRAAAGDARDLIVFYDLQLSGVQDTTRVALGSPITRAVKSLLGEPSRRALVVIHSAELSPTAVAESLDERKGRVISNLVVTGRNREHIEGGVKTSLEAWHNLYPSESLSAEEFLLVMEEMTHEQLQDYAEFLKKEQEKEVDPPGKEVDPKEKEAALRLRYPDPKETLRKYLIMGVAEFEENFCNASGNLRGEVIEALKSISGVYDQKANVYLGRPLTWGGAWLLALGVFRGLLPRDTWRTIFTPGELSGAQQEDGAQQKWPPMHAMQKPPRRAATVRLFVKMVRVLFTRRGTTNESVLEKVELAVKPQTQLPHKLSFRLSFPCVGHDENQSESLLGRLVSHVDHALAVAEGRAVEHPGGEGRDTSRAIWRFFLSASICDSKDAVGKHGYGMAGGFSPMNIMSVEDNTKTEVLWLK